MTLYLLVEGDDDERFVQRIVIPKLSSPNCFVQPYKFAQKKKAEVNRFLRIIKAMGAQYLLLADINAQPCLRSKKKALLQKFAQLDDRRVVIVVREIESWYLAGLADNNPLGVQVPANTSEITKERFNGTIPKHLDSRIDYMLEVLKLFDINTATGRNPSFHYFAPRCGLLRS